MTLEKIKQKLTSSDKYRSLPTPIYLADLNAFKTNLNDLLTAFRKHYNNFNIGYSFKTNYYEGFLKIAREFGCMAEVVSPSEYRMALANGFKEDEIIYNGVIPAVGQKLSVILHGGIVNFDNVDELARIVLKSPRNKPLEIGLRMNIAIGNGVPSRFGIKPDSQEYELIRDWVKDGVLKVKAIHCHISYARSLEKFKIRMEKMLEIAQHLHPSIIDLGGNMYGRVDPLIESQFVEDTGTMPTYEDYAEVIAGHMETAYPNEDVKLLIECGTPVLGNCMYLLTTCINTKQYRTQSPIAVLDCTHYDVGFVIAKKNAAIYPLNGNEEVLSGARIFGCSCVEEDLLHSCYTGSMRYGSKYLIANVGAYGMNMANDFIIEKPPVISLF